MAAEGPQAFTIDAPPREPAADDPNQPATRFHALLPDRETIWRTSKDILTTWRDDYTLAAYRAVTTDVAGLGGFHVQQQARPAADLTESVWVFNDDHYRAALADVLADQDISTAAISATSLAIFPTPFDEHTVHLLPTGVRGKAVARIDGTQTWRATRISEF